MRKIKYVAWVLLATLIACFATACKKCADPEVEEPPVTTIELTLNLKNVDIPVGGKVTLKATLQGSVEEISWSTSDETVATVDGGTVYGVAEGTTTITANVGETKAECVVNVSGEREEDVLLQEIPVLHFSLSAEKIWIGYSFTPTATLKLAGEAVATDVTFTSADSSIAKIDDGKIVGVSVGKTTITASCRYEGKLYQKTATIEVVGDN